MPRPSVPSRRSDILLAARDAFNARGFAGARMEDIARAVGISKAALYLQFGSKEALFEALTTELIEATLPTMAPAQFGDIPAETLLRGFITTLTGRLASPELAFVPRVIIGEAMNFPELARFYHDHVIERGLAVVEAIIRHGIARGELACDDPPLACRTVVGGLLVGAIWKMVFEPVGARPVEAEAAARVHADTILNGLIVRKELA
ncbi:MAG: TetR/AcrR family transcriptional regulator [Proteobacteria bacterium]|nr:TetR/AcrR family transcriptional regulator [Pseudomonadota bacterium]MDE2411309.1 TetR/AcrR family transcriptional regulator [Sphingomonadales bacterium]